MMVLLAVVGLVPIALVHAILRLLLEAYRQSVSEENESLEVILNDITELRDDILNNKPPKEKREQNIYFLKNVLFQENLFDKSLVNCEIIISSAPSVQPEIGEPWEWNTNETREPSICTVINQKCACEVRRQERRLTIRQLIQRFPMLTLRQTRAPVPQNREGRETENKAGGEDIRTICDNSDDVFERDAGM
jgi:hypothetical protein